MLFVSKSPNKSYNSLESSPTCGPLLSESVCGANHIQMNNSQVSSGDLLIPKPKFDNPSVITSPCSEQTSSQKTDYQSYNRFLINIVSYLLSICLFFFVPYNRFCRAVNFIIESSPFLFVKK